MVACIKEVEEEVPQILYKPVSHDALCFSVAPVTVPPATKAAAEPWAVGTTSVPQSVTKVSNPITFR